MKNIILCFLLTSFSCTDTEIESVKAYGNAATVKCYSGGILIYDGKSTGRVATVHNSDGWEFKDVKTQSFTRVSGDCVVIHD
jgi:hypothetical protein